MTARHWAGSAAAALGIGAEIVVAPGFDAHYYGYYLHGLEELVGRRSIRFGPLSFERAIRARDCLAYVVGNDAVRVFVSASDHPTLDLDALEWCDVYGKVNCDRSRAPSEQVRKVLALGPSFGLRAWGPLRTCDIAFRTFGAMDGQHGDVRCHLASYLAQYRKRLPLSAYKPGPSDPGFVFFTSWLWKKHPEANPLRARFMRVCREFDDLQFEGGFAPRRRRDVAGFEDITAPRRYRLSKYLAGIRRSAVAFNSPAVHGCHGWKLGEFLALGKAILSTPLTWELPAPLVHGQHVHIVDGSSESIREALSILRTDHAYRHSLERAARSYFDEYVAPAAATARLHAHGRDQRLSRR